MKHLFGRPVFGFLLAPLCALAACVGAVDRPSPVESSIGMQEQSVVDDNVGDDSIGPDVFNETHDLGSCLAQCDGDAECRHCCFCGAKPGCCF
jgi:hypothetical protein